MEEELTFQEMVQSAIKNADREDLEALARAVHAGGPDMNRLVYATGDETENAAWDAIRLAFKAIMENRTLMGKATATQTSSVA